MMATQHSLNLTVEPYSDGSYLLEWDTWTRIEEHLPSGDRVLAIGDGLFRARHQKTAVPDFVALRKVINSIMSETELQSAPGHSAPVLGCSQRKES